jgi:hypothetical protein
MLIAQLKASVRRSPGVGQKAVPLRQAFEDISD